MADGQANRDIIYRTNPDEIEFKIKTYVKAAGDKPDSEPPSRPFKGKQAILFVHHTKPYNIPHMEANVDEIERNPKLKFEDYRFEIELKARDKKRDEFEKQEIQFLLATPNMYKKNGHFRGFVHEQIWNKDILIGVEIWKNDYLGEDDNPGYNEQLETLKNLYPQQKWIVFTDYEGERYDEMRTALRLNDAQVEDRRG